MVEGIFERTERLVGAERMRALSACRVILFGVGGVGSWCAESLIRTGVQHLTIVDCDWVSVSNVNRQLMATTATVGKEKVEVMKERLLQINPAAEITALNQVFCEETADSFQLDTYDYIIDAIDSLRDKLLLMLRATACEHPVFFSSMGAALKMDPTQIRVTEFRKVEGDPLARALRHRMKHYQCFPTKKFLCVYSSERMENDEAADGHVEQTAANVKKRINGSIVHVTAVFGFTLASLVIRDILSKA